ncbi:GNAT family N-acetyltransferase [Nocardioides montaniterrae]
MTDISIARADERHRYEIHVDGELAGFAQYLVPDATHLDFVHTEIDPAYAGQGLAGQLVKVALDDVRAQGKRAIPHCPYVASYIRKHPEYADLADFPGGD